MEVKKVKVAKEEDAVTITKSELEKILTNVFYRESEFANVGAGVPMKFLLFYNANVMSKIVKELFGVEKENAN